MKIKCNLIRSIESNQNQIKSHHIKSNHITSHLSIDQSVEVSSFRLNFSLLLRCSSVTDGLMSRLASTQNQALPVLPNESDSSDPDRAWYNPSRQSGIAFWDEQADYERYAAARRKRKRRYVLCNRAICNFKRMHVFRKWRRLVARRRRLRALKENHLAPLAFEALNEIVELIASFLN